MRQIRGLLLAGFILAAALGQAGHVLAQRGGAPAAGVKAAPRAPVAAEGALVLGDQIEGVVVRDGGPQAAVAPSPAVEPQPGTILHFATGDSLAGVFVPSDKPGTVRWQSPAFVGPFEFDLNALNAVYFPLPAKAPEPVGEYCFELSGGDVLFGQLLALDKESAELEVSPFGRLHVSRDRIHGIYRRSDGSGLVYLGPNTLAEWDPTSTKAQWREEHGQLVSDQAGASLFGDFGLPTRAAIEIELSWQKKPDFLIALGVDSGEKSTRQAFRFEAWERDLVLLRETAKEADVASVQTLPTGAGRLHLQIFLDQEAGRCLVFSERGEALADLKVAASAVESKEGTQADSQTKPAPFPGLRFTNKRGDLRIERLRIDRWLGKWDGAANLGQGAGKSRLFLADGTTIYGDVTAFDAAAKQFVVQADSGESRVPVDRVASLFLPHVEASPARVMSAVFHDGSRLGGTLLSVADTSAWMTSPGVRERLHVSLKELRSLLVLRRGAPAVAEPKLTGTLELEGVRLRGRLVDGQQREDASCLVWQPAGSSTASALHPGISGRIVYREPAVNRTAAAAAAANNPAAGAAIARRVAGGVVQGGQPAPTPFTPTVQSDAAPQTLHLRTGDTIACVVTGISEEGVSIRTPLSDATFVPHNRIKAAELARDTEVPISLSPIKKERLLILPRMQKENPPTHLIRSRNGDYLRGRIMQMDDKKLNVEVRLESKEVPRDRVALIIWLHPDELEGETTAPKFPEEPGKTRAQALFSAGNRLTFFADQFAGTTLSGTSEVLGACRAALETVDQLLFGSAIEQAAAKLAYHQWKLQHAVEPKFAQDDGSDSPDGGRSTGTDTALVGKPAPDFELDLLGGPKFRLSTRRGKVMILDFWATWCGPCVQAMPQVDRVAREFADRGVEVVAVNLEEAPDKVQAMLERHKLELTVALDRDGATAAKYGVTAIPQTLIIDKEGKVHRHYIGGGAHLGDQLAEALEALLNPDKAGSEKPADKPGQEKPAQEKPDADKAND